MSDPVTINPSIVEGLYCEALSLSDEVRSAFALPGAPANGSAQHDLARTALTSEGLRTTTRMMYAIAWLLNYRAFFRGEISELQLRRYGRLSPDRQPSDPEQFARLDPPVAELVEATSRFYERLLRLDCGLRQDNPAGANVVERLRERIEQRLVG
jgi:regulator of CtrA degradation